jgi:hypothetical protein
VLFRLKKAPFLMRKSTFSDMKKHLFWVSTLDVGVPRLDVRVSSLDLGVTK